MNAIVKPGIEGYPSPTYQQVMEVDGQIPDILKLQSVPPLPTADLPLERYTSREFFDREMSRMWSRVWQYACREEHIPEAGDYTVYDLGRRSFVITRTETGAIKAFYNSCRHRGTKLKPSGSAGTSRSIACPFHGWEWNLDGSNRNIPCSWDFPQVDRSKVGLVEARVDAWNGFVFINPSPTGPGLREYLEVLPQHFSQWDYTNWYVHAHVQKKLPCNWKSGLEAFMEAYHTPVAHPTMTHVVGDINMQHDIFSDHVSRDLCPMASPSPTSKLNLSQQELLDRMLMGDSSMVDKPKVPEGKTARWVIAEQLRQTMAAQYGLDYSTLTVPEMIDSIKYHVFPNILLTSGIGFRVLLQFRPLGHDQDRSTLDLHIFHPKPKDGSKPDVAECIYLSEDDLYTTVSSLDPFLASVFDEDTNILRLQREGMQASGAGAEILACYQEGRIRHLHEVIDKYLRD
jgi:phenylpropionate dioxygenase-like ring-hydroxylating dioxygenase large terminal subunit